MAIAEMLVDEAPEVCEYIRSVLPMEAKAIHGMYSGAEVFTMIEGPRAVKAQNRVSLPLPGELLYFHDDGTGGVGRGKPVGEICFVYGRGVMLKGHEGAAASASLFARIPGDWKHDWVEFAQACRRCRWQGPQQLRIEVAE